MEAHLLSSILLLFQKSSPTATLPGKLNFPNVLPLELQSKEKRHRFRFLWRCLLALPSLQCSPPRFCPACSSTSSQGLSPCSLPRGIHHPIGGLIRSVPGTVLAAGDVTVNKTHDLSLWSLYSIVVEKDNKQMRISIEGQNKVE